jgi:hypothetical protein
MLRWQNVNVISEEETSPCPLLKGEEKPSQAEGNDKEETSSLSPPERRREKTEIGSFLKGLCVEVAIGKTTILRVANPL